MTTLSHEKAVQDLHSYIDMQLAEKLGREVTIEESMIVGHTIRMSVAPDRYDNKDYMEALERERDYLKSNNKSYARKNERLRDALKDMLEEDDAQAYKETRKLLREDDETKRLQEGVWDWTLACFGEEITRDKVERNQRFFEEACELVQACKMTREDAHILVDYVYDKPVGEIKQESGGVSLTHAALCNAQEIDMSDCAFTELSRVWGKVEQIREKQRNKPKNSPLPQHVKKDEGQELVDALNKLDKYGYQEEGWSPNIYVVVLLLVIITAIAFWYFNFR